MSKELNFFTDFQRWQCETSKLLTNIVHWFYAILAYFTNNIFFLRLYFFIVKIREIFHTKLLFLYCASFVYATAVQKVFFRYKNFIQKCKQKKSVLHKQNGFFDGRSGGTRTRGLLVPNQAHYQTVPHPDSLIII